MILTQAALALALSQSGVDCFDDLEPADRLRRGAGVRRASQCGVVGSLGGQERK